LLHPIPRCVFLQEFSNGAVLFLGSLEAAHDAAGENSARINLRVDCRGREKNGRPPKPGYAGLSGHVPNGEVAVLDVPFARHVRTYIRSHSVRIASMG
jgi:hypothetical protein